MKAKKHPNPINHLSSVRILRGHEWQADPCPAIHKIASENYGSTSALPVSLLRHWYKKNSSIIRIALIEENSIAGYLSALPLLDRMFSQTIEPDFNETSISADDIYTGLFPAKGGVFISSIVVARKYQKHLPVSILLRLALINDLVAQHPGNQNVLHISAQALSPKGEACMRSLGMQGRGYTDHGWKIFFGRLNRDDLQTIRRELLRKLETRFNMPVGEGI